VDGERKFEAARIASVPYSHSGSLEPEKPIEVDMRTRFPINARDGEIVFVKSKK
jgi:hypothetical protein